MAKTVSIPTAIAADMVLNGKLSYLFGFSFIILTFGTLAASSEELAFFRCTQQHSQWTIALRMAISVRQIAELRLWINLKDGGEELLTKTHCAL